MADRKELMDEKRIQELYERLNWFTFVATEEEFDPEEVNGIVDLLDTLDPQGKAYICQPLGESSTQEETRIPAGDARTALMRFKRKYRTI